MSTVRETVPPVTPEKPPVPRPAPPWRRHRLRWLMIAVALVAVVIGVRVWLGGRARVTTDDAQIEGHIVPVIAKVGGYVAAVDAQENRAVVAGRVLVQLDDRDLRARLAEAEAQLAAAQAVAGAGRSVGEAEARTAAARANIAQAEAAERRARADLTRYRTLAESNIISRQQLEQAEATATSAAAQLAAARDQAAAATAGERAATSQHEAAGAARDEAALQLSYARVVAPANGVISRKAVEVGQLVQPGQQLMTLVPLEDVWVVANLKETQLRGVDPGDPVDIHVDSDPSRPRTGQVESISPATGAKFSLLPPDNATGNFTKVVQRVPVRIRLVSPNDPAHPLRPGMSVKVTIHTRGSATTSPR
jgi:membrane fusion protein (multidrug efflux system)